ncbi:MAG TPA: hypothetical protein PLP29_15385 [Candidatus Ozemobacteraceae bacterium]|nr:hypothetical protein [Candidatus Ozemobacteraceae bacterium]
MSSSSSFFASFVSKAAGFVLAASLFIAGPAPALAQEVGDATLSGLSGTMLVPGLEVLPPGGARAAAHINGGDGVDRVGSLKGTFAFSDDTEIAVMKRFVTGSGKTQFDPAFSVKYRIRPTVTAAAIIDTTEGWNESVMLLTGLPGNKVVVGLGANLSLEGSDRYAHFGRYPDRFSPVDPLFFVMGATLNIDPETQLIMDYAGNDFLLGLRHHLNDALALDFGYLAPDNLTRESRYTLGANFGF